MRGARSFERVSQPTCFPFLFVVITGRTMVVVPVWMTAFCTWWPEVVTATGTLFGALGGIVMVVVSVAAASSSSLPEMVTGFTARNV